MGQAHELSGYAERYDYRVDILRRLNQVTAIKDGIKLAESRHTLIVDEQDHGIVFYFPRADVRLDRLEPMLGRTTRCPYKGDASYWSHSGEPVAWSYEDPYPEVGQIKGHVAFYQDRVTVSVGAAPSIWERPKEATA
jgi:uncharacterized protein (DUF427 family)